MENYAVHLPQAASSIPEAQKAPGMAREAGLGSCTASLLGLLLSSLGLITPRKTNNGKHLNVIHLSDCLTLGSVQNRHRPDGLFSAYIFSLLLANDLRQSQSRVTENNTPSTKRRPLLPRCPECPLQE